MWPFAYYYLAAVLYGHRSLFSKRAVISLLCTRHPQIETFLLPEVLFVTERRNILNDHQSFKLEIQLNTMYNLVPTSQRTTASLLQKLFIAI
jgi:hypothetical protein